MNIVSKLCSSFTSFPEDIAISDGDREITYASLYSQCAKVASYLQQNHIADSFIAIEVDNTADHIIAIVGVLMSGNAYVSVTAENKPFLSAVDSLQIRLTITSDISVSSPNTVCLNHMLMQALPEAYKEETRQGNNIDPTAPMCAFFTSGSTGTSKIIVHTHQNIVTDTVRQVNSNTITSSDKLDLVFSLSFSASLACIFPALFTGAELAVFNLKQKGLHLLADFWQQKKITFSTLSVSSFQGVCKIHSSLKHLAAMRFISISAEPVKDTTIDFFKSRFPASCFLQIAYATTETRTISEIKIYNDNRPQPFTESIGKPVEGKLVYITDADGNCLPTNTVGEIRTQSKYIADSYWAHPEESKLSFSKKEEMICFHTGDSGYLNEEGYLFYTGRSVYEYKLNGIKINIADIEQAAEKADGVTIAAAVICMSGNGQQKLTCFYTSAGNNNIHNNRLTEQKIKLSISSELPASHQPHFYIQLPQMPLTHSGKVDRKALEKIDPVVHSAQTNNASSPNDSKEDNCETTSVIVDVFKRILETPAINTDSNFFDCGGDSLSCLVCIADIETALRIQLSNYALASHPTPKKLSEFICNRSITGSSLIEIKELNEYSLQRRNLYFLHHLQDSTYHPLILGKLSEQFNLVMCYYDLRHIHETENAANCILQELTSLVAKHRNPVVVGYSISGYLAYQLACVLPNITCAMIDTYNYFEPERYRRKKGLQSRFRNLCWQVLQNKDFAYPWFLIHSKYKWIRNNKQVWEDERFFTGVNYLVKNLKHTTAQHNCIYFQASRHHQDCGASWKSYVRGRFHYRIIKSTHHTIIKDHAEKISGCIIQTASSW